MKTEEECLAYHTSTSAVGRFGGPAVLADQLGFKNGDRLSGSVVKSDDKNLVFNSTAAGGCPVARDP